MNIYATNISACQHFHKRNRKHAIILQSAYTASSVIGRACRWILRLSPSSTLSIVTTQTVIYNYYG